MTLKRSNMEFSKRVFLDRLTTQAQGCPGQQTPVSVPVIRPSMSTYL